MQHTSRDLLDAQWTILDPLIPEPKRRNDGKMAGEGLGSHDEVSWTESYGS